MKDEDGNYKLIGTTLPDLNGKVLSIYEFDIINLRVQRKIKDCLFEKKIARNAGNIISIGNHKYRVCQNFENHYGNGIYFQQIKNKAFDKQEMFYFNLNDFRNNLGLHTLNSYGDLSVVDVHGYRNPIIGRLFAKLLMRP